MITTVAPGFKDAIVGAVGGFIAGGPAGAIAGGVAGALGGGDAGQGGDFGAPQSFTNTSTCPPGTFRVGDKCVNPGAMLPGGVPFTTTPGAVTPGAFGALSTDAIIVSSVKLRCPPGLVLGKDDRCYAQGKGGISNRQRKWPAAPKPWLSARDKKLLTKADSIRGKVKTVATTAGFSCKKR